MGLISVSNSITNSGFNCLVCGEWNFLDSFRDPEYPGVCVGCLADSSKIILEAECGRDSKNSGPSISGF